MDLNPSASVNAGASQTDPDAAPVTSSSPSAAPHLASGQHDIAIINSADEIVHEALALVPALVSASGSLDPESLDTHPATNLDAAPTNTVDITLELTPPTVGENANTNESTLPFTRKSRGRGHRALSSVWQYLTREENPHKATSTMCMHCSAVVPHHHKSEKARSHLKRCAAFRTYLADSTCEEQPPDWLDEDSNKRTQRVPTTEDGDNARAAIPGQLTSASSSGSHAKRHKSVHACGGAHADVNAVADAMAMYIYTTGLPFSHMDHPHLRRAVQMSLPPALTLRHSSQDLVGSLLDRAFASVQCDLLRVTQRPGAVNAVCVNSWFATQELQRDEEPTGLVVVGTAKAPLNVDSTPIALTDSNATSQGLFDTLAGALSLCGDNIHGVVTDNSHADQLVWAKFKTIFPSKFFHGCASHGLHLFVGQIFERTEETEADSPAPFADLHQLVVDCRELVQCFSRSAPENVADQVKKKLNETGIEKLWMPPSGQWTKLKAGLESVLLVLPILQEAISTGAFDCSGVTEEKATSRQRIQEITSNSDLESLLFKAVALVDPLDTLMKRLQVDADVPISEVFYWFAKQLPVALSRVPGLTEAESAYLLKLNQNRFNAMYGDSHGMAYLLDPRYVGEGLSPEVRKNIEDLVYLTPLIDQVDQIDLDKQKSIVAQQLTEYVIDATQEKATDSFRYSIVNKNQKSVLQYWQTDGLRWPMLQRVAVRLFSLPASTLPMTQRVLDVPLRLPPDELAAETLKKLKFIQLNHALLTNESVSAGSQRKLSEAVA